MLGLGASVAIPAVLSGFENLQSIDLDGTGDFVDTNYSVADLQTLQRDDFTISMPAFAFLGIAMMVAY